MNQFQRCRDRVRGELKLYRGQVSGRPGAVVDQVQTGSRDLKALLYDLIGTVRIKKKKLKTLSYVTKRGENNTTK